MSDYSTIDTKYGMIRISITDGDHIFISAADAVTFWGVRYSLSVHLVRYEDGWAIQRDGHGRTRWDCLSGTRQRWTNYNQAGLSAGARKRVAEEIVPVVAKWASENSDLIDVAQHKHIEAEIARREEKIAEHQNAITELVTEIIALREGVAR